MHYDNCDSTDEGRHVVYFEGLIFFFFLGGGNVVFKVGTHTRSSICESHRRLSTLSRPPCFTATRMSRLSSWFTWSVLNVEAGKAAEEEEEVEEEEEEEEEGGVRAEWEEEKKKSSALFFHLGVSNELFYKKEKRRQDGSWSQGEQRRVMGSLAGFTDGPMRRPAAAQTRSLGELKRITSCNSYCVKAPAASTDTDTHGQRRRRRRTPSVSSRHTTWLSIHVTRSDITARHHRNYRGSRN